MADQWFYAVNEERRGPVGRDTLARLVREGQPLATYFLLCWCWWSSDGTRCSRS